MSKKDLEFTEEVKVSDHLNIKATPDCDTICGKVWTDDFHACALPPHGKEMMHRFVAKDRPSYATEADDATISAIPPPTPWKRKA